MQEDELKRDYQAMRDIVALIGRAKGKPVGYTALRSFAEPDVIAYEAKRLKDDGLVESTMRFDVFREYEGGEIMRLTDEGEEFCNLIVKGDVWAVILDTLNAADVNIPYPLLKEVCEEIVKRYVVSFIPEQVR